MENIMFNIKMLAAYKNESIAELAEHSDIDPVHLQQVSAGRLKMTADDLIKLSDYTGIDIRKIQY